MGGWRHYRVGGRRGWTGVLTLLRNRQLKFEMTDATENLVEVARDWDLFTVLWGFIWAIRRLGRWGFVWTLGGFKESGDSGAGHAGAYILPDSVVTPLGRGARSS